MHAREKPCWETVVRLDVLTLRTFYFGPLGVMAQRMILRRTLALWPDAQGQDVLGFGYATPFLEPYRASARRVVSFMPWEQGVERWPGDGPAASALGDVERLPFRDAVFDKVIIAHALEETTALRPLLREVWRIMAPEGRLLVIAANRRGLWSRADSTPFGHGRPYSQNQLATALGEAMFQPVAWARAVYAPPAAWGPVLGAADAWERAGERFWPHFAGVVLAEAVKRLYAGAGGTKGRILFAGAAQPAATGLRKGDVSSNLHTKHRHQRQQLHEVRYRNHQTEPP
jgi:SAM-dependent methyltransferase